MHRIAPFLLLFDTAIRLPPNTSRLRTDGEADCSLQAPGLAVEMLRHLLSQSRHDHGVATHAIVGSTTFLFGCLQRRKAVAANTWLGVAEE
jgi:hypothetical protein